MATYSLARIVFSAIIIYLGLYFVLIMFIDKIIFLPNIPSRKIEVTPDKIGLKYKDVTIECDDGVKLNGWFFKGSSEITILFFHGNAGNISHRLGFAQRFHDMGYNSLLFDYRGYGLSTGTPSEKGIYKDSLAAWKFLSELKEVNKDKIILYGHSLGGAAAAEVALHHKTKLLVLEATFASIRSIGSRIFPYSLYSPFIPEKLNTISKLKNVKAEMILISHDENDKVIPYAESEKLHKACPENSSFFKLKEVGHNSVFENNEYFDYLDKLIKN